MGLPEFLQIVFHQGQEVVDPGLFFRVPLFELGFQAVVCGGVFLIQCFSAVKFLPEGVPFFPCFHVVFDVVPGGAFFQGFQLRGVFPQGLFLGGGQAFCGVTFVLQALLFCEQGFIGIGGFHVGVDGVDLALVAFADALGGLLEFAADVFRFTAGVFQLLKLFV